MFRRLLFLFLPLALAGCDKPLVAPAIRVVHPAIWVLKDADTTIYLFGTVHLLRPGYRWLDGKVRDALESSSELVTEIDPPTRDEMAQALRTHALDTSPPPLRSRVPHATAEVLDRALTRYGIAPDALDAIKPWYAAIVLSTTALRQQGYSPDRGVEAVLTREAGRLRMTRTGLETIDAQFALLASLSPEAGTALLEHTLDNLPRLPTTMDAITEAWCRGDTDALARLLNEDLGDSPELTETMLWKRNQRWADWIAKRMAAPGVVFVAVGAGHLAGTGSVQDELAKRGFRAVRIAS